MLNRISRYFKGYLRVRISGKSAERFINTCSYKRIHIWNLSAENSYYELNIILKDFKKLKPVIRKTKTKVMIVERTGFPFFIYKYRKRKLFFIGLISGIILLFHLSTYIWCINIEGNISNSTENLTQFLSSIDILPGVKSKDINCSYISREIRENYDDIIWVSTSLEGSNLNIKIKENQSADKTDVMNTISAPYDIIADEDCQITDVIIREGIVQIQMGDYVQKGDILISGQIPVYNDAKEIVHYKYCISDADIYGTKTISYEDTLPLDTFDKKYMDIEKQEYYIKIHNTRLSLGGIENEYSNFEEISKEVSFRDFSIGIRKVRPYEKIIRQYTKDELQQVFSANFQYYCRELEKKGVVILKNNVKIYTWSDKAKAKGTLTVEMPIGHRVKSQLLETGDHIDGNDGNNN